MTTALRRQVGATQVMPPDISQLCAPTKRARLNALTLVLPNRNVKVLPYSGQGITKLQVLFSLIPRPDRELRMHLAVHLPSRPGAS